jgi:hypothetical protein
MIDDLSKGWRCADRSRPGDQTTKRSLEPGNTGSVERTRHLPRSFRILRLSRCERASTVRIVASGDETLSVQALEIQLFYRTSRVVQRTFW